MNKTDYIDRIKELVAEELSLPIEEIDEDENFMRMGLSSLGAMNIIGTIEDENNIEISPVAVFEYKTISDFAEYLANGGETDFS